MILHDGTWVLSYEQYRDYLWALTGRSLDEATAIARNKYKTQQGHYPEHAPKPKECDPWPLFPRKN